MPHVPTLDRTRVPPDVHSICSRLRAAGHAAWIVGGCVRDMLRGETAADWDVATSALPEQLVALFPAAIPTGLAHGTLTVVLGGRHYEVTTLRGDGDYSDGRRPDSVQFVDDIVADLARRDFTVNAMAVDLQRGVLIDPFGGQRDLAARVLRAVGDPRQRFAEDGLRVLRAARFAATLEFELDPATFAAIEPNLDTYRKVAAERVREEWLKAMKAARPSRAFEIMRTSGILGVSCPELLAGVGMAQNHYHSYDVWTHAMACMDACAGDPGLRLAALLHDVGKPATRAFSEKTNDWTFYAHDKVGAEIADPILERLRFSNDERARIVQLVRHHLFHYDGWSDAAVRRWIRRVGRERVEDLCVLSTADLIAKGPVGDPAFLGSIEALREHVARVLAEGAALSRQALDVDGNVLMEALGLPPGPLIGRLLDGLLEAVIAEPALNERGALLERARALAARES